MAADPSNPYRFDDNENLVRDESGIWYINLHPLMHRMNAIALVYMCIVLAYVSFVVTLSTFSMNLAPLRVAEDVWLLGLVAFACYTMVLDHRFYKEGEYLLVDNAGSAKSCKSRFLDYFPLDDLCRNVVAFCSEAAPENFRYGEEPASLLGRLLTLAAILVLTML